MGIVSSSALVATVAQAADVYTPGVMMRRFWNLPGLNNDWRNVTNNVRYPDAPDRTDYVAEMGSPDRRSQHRELRSRDLRIGDAHHHRFVHLLRVR